MSSTHALCLCPWGRVIIFYCVSQARSTEYAQGATRHREGLMLPAGSTMNSERHILPIECARRGNDSPCKKHHHLASTLRFGLQAGHALEVLHRLSSRADAGAWLAVAHQLLHAVQLPAVRPPSLPTIDSSNQYVWLLQLSAVPGKLRPVICINDSYCVLPRPYTADWCVSCIASVQPRLSQHDHNAPASN